MPGDAFERLGDVLGCHTISLGEFRRRAFHEHWWHEVVDRGVGLLVNVCVVMFVCFHGRGDVGFEVCFSWDANGCWVGSAYLC